MHRLLLLALFVAIWAGLEARILKKKGETLWSKWIYLEKNRSPHPAWPLLNFATMSLLFFAAWEFLLRWILLPRAFFDVSVILGIFGWTAFLICRFDKKLDQPSGFNSVRKVRPDLLWMMWLTSSVMLMGSYFSLFLLPWPYWRAGFLRKA